MRLALLSAVAKLLRVQFKVGGLPYGSINPKIGQHPSAISYPDPSDTPPSACEA